MKIIIPKDLTNRNKIKYNKKNKKRKTRHKTKTIK